MRATPPSEVRAIIDGELTSVGATDGPHGVDLERALLAVPEKRDYADGFDTRRFELWLVLEEGPAGYRGYQIVFDEESQSFGLAVPGHECGVLIGLYGTFLDTLAGM